MEHFLQTQIKRYVYMLSLVLVLAVLLGIQYTLAFPTEAEVAFQKIVQQLEHLQGATHMEVASAVFLNNAVLAFFALFGGIVFGIFPVIFIFSNGYILGVIGSLVSQHIGYTTLILGILPHGIFEIPAALLASGTGVWLGTKAWGRVRRGEPIKEHLHFATKVFLKVIIPTLVIAALVEAFITPEVIQLSQSSKEVFIP